jgi:NitT/TauT family transport system permease protein
LWKSENNRYTFHYYLLGVVAILGVWQVAALYVASEIILPAPVPVARELAVLIKTPRFLQALGLSFLRLVVALVFSAPLGIIAGLAAGLNKRAAAFLRPFFSLISATPVMSVILIAYLVFGSERTPVFTAFLVVFPVMAANTIEGVKAIDTKLIELFDVYKIPAKDRLQFLYIPSLLPFFAGGLRSALSLCWKVVVAAEVLVQPAAALGTGMQSAKAHLQTPELFAWTIATVAAAAASEGLLKLASNAGKK